MSSGDPRTRERILEKTWQLMERRRGRQVNIDDIARLAGISRQAIYLHFGSRAGLLIATVRYVDQVRGVAERVRAVTTASDGLAMLDALVEFWGNYMPEIDGLARALLVARETDKAASAAWDDRMRVFRQGCVSITRCLAREQRLAPEWTPDQAADALWAMLSIPVWENLTLECGWTNAEYVSRMQAALRRTFVR